VVIADSTIWIDFFAGRGTPEALWLKRELSLQEVGLTDLSFCEVLQGVRHDADFRRTHLRLTSLPILNCCGEELAVASAQNYRMLRARGFTVRKTIDCLIATFCIEHGHALLHRDRDFDPFEAHLGLKVIHP
jgi:predicted nucleic acid-binding protein